MRSASCRETSPATKPVRLSIQHRVQRLLDRSTNHLTKMIPDPRLINLDHLSIGFASLIGCSFILEEAVNPLGTTTIAVPPLWGVGLCAKPSKFWTLPDATWSFRPPTKAARVAEMASREVPAK